MYPQSKKENNVEFVRNSTGSRMMFYSQAAVNKHPSRRSDPWTKWIIQFCTYSHFKMLSKLCCIYRYSELHLSNFLLLSEKVLFWKRGVSQSQMFWFLVSFDSLPRSACTFAYTIALDETILNLQGESSSGSLTSYNPWLDFVWFYPMTAPCEITLTL